jgi:hypothetical protein
VFSATPSALLFKYNLSSNQIQRHELRQVTTDVFNNYNISQQPLLNFFVTRLIDGEWFILCHFLNSMCYTATNV